MKEKNRKSSWLVFLKVVRKFKVSRFEVNFENSWVIFNLLQLNKK
jgi:hypothetical protein